MADGLVGRPVLCSAKGCTMIALKNAVMFFIVCAAVPVFAQTTGHIEGTVTDPDGLFLPGATVEIASLSMQGTRIDVSDADGKFRFTAIPPGEYSLTASLGGFGTVHHEDVDVGLDRHVTLRIEMKLAAFEEVVEVTGEAPLVDVTTAELGTNFDQQDLTSMPLARNFTAIANVLAGVQYEDDTTNGFAIYGSTGAENVYIIDGVDTTEIERGRQGKTINMEFVKEVQVKTGGYNAEYGRSTGGVINVITKSGGNDFHGDVFGYYHTDDTQASFKGEGADDLINPWSRPSTGLTRSDYGFDLGGYILRDRLWFFVAYDRVQRKNTDLTTESSQELFGAPAELDTDREQDQRSAKLTWNVAPSHTLVGTIFGDPEMWDWGANGRMIRGPQDTYWNRRETGGDDYALKYLGLPTDDLLIDVQLSHHEESNVRIPWNTADVRMSNGRAFPYPVTGGYGWYSDSEYSRDQARLDLTYYLDAAGTHELKAGYELQDLESDIHWQITGGQSVGVGRCDPDYPYERADCSLALQDEGGYYYYRHAVFVTNDSTLADWTLSPEGIFENLATENRAAYLRDNWRVLPGLTLNLGLRWEEQVLMDDLGRVWIDLDDNWAPRLGLIWDVNRDGRSRAYAQYGRFFESIPMDINNRWMSTQAVGEFYNTDPHDITPNNDLRRGRIYGTLSTMEILELYFGSPVDPNLVGQSIDEWVVGYEANLLTNWTFGLAGVFRQLNTVIEDGGAIVDGEFLYVLGNGGEGFLSESPDLHWTGSYPVPEPKREYTAVQLTARRRYRDNWTMYASYVWSSLEGNYDGVYQRSTGQLDPNINSAYDYVDFMYVVDYEDPFTTELDGPLSNDREHQLKVSGFYTFGFGFEVGASAYWQSGRPISAQGWADDYFNNELWLTQRGGLGRMPDEYELDLHFGYPFDVGPVTINLLLDIFNVLDRQGVTDIDMTWNILDEFATVDGSIAGCEQWGGSHYDPAIPDHCAPNADYMKNIAWQGPRYFRLGLKVSF
jgi:hypothetical protein